MSGDDDPWNTSRGPALVVRLLQADVYFMGQSGWSGTVESAFACSVEGDGAVSCEGPLVVGRAPGWPATWDVADLRFPKVHAETLAWTERREPVLGPDGDLRLAP